MRHLLPLLLLIGCADATDDDSDREAESAPEQLAGKDDASSLTGLYATTTTALKNGDIPNLELTSGGAFVRRRCYHTNCALPVAESDAFDTYTSSAGKRYIRFYATETEWNAAHDDRNEVRVVGDVYEVIKTSTTLKLRKSYSSRWVTLKKTTRSALCTGDGGTWSSSACTCPGATAGWNDDGYIAFVPGLGGCAQIPGVGEGECDDTGGWYTDDDATPVATYCRCDKGSYLSNAGCDAI